MINFVGSDKKHLDTFYLGDTEKILGDICLRKDDILNRRNLESMFIVLNNDGVCITSLELFERGICISLENTFVGKLHRYNDFSAAKVIFDGENVNYIISRVDSRVNDGKLYVNEDVIEELLSFMGCKLNANENINEIQTYLNGLDYTKKVGKSK